MGIAISVLLILLLLIQILLLIKAIKNKDNKEWIKLFSTIVSSILGVVLIFVYSLNFTKLSWNSLYYIALGIIATFIYLFILLLSIIIKIIQTKKLAKNNIEIRKMENKIKLIFLSFLIIIAISILCIGIDFTTYKIYEKIQINNYNEIKNNEINKMANYINKKYDLYFQSEDCTYYKEEDYLGHYDILYNGKKYNIPYITIFEKDDKKITVVDRKGFISDDYQLKDINSYLGKYFENITGIPIEFVQVNKSYNYDGRNDNTINEYIQTKFNELMTEKNINGFMKEILKKENLKLKLYIKNYGDIDSLKQEITTKFNYIESYINVNEFEIHVYDQNSNLNIEFHNPDLEDDYNDEYKFGNYYILNENNKILFSAYLNLDRGYNPPVNINYEKINNWFIHIY